MKKISNAEKVESATSMLTRAVLAEKSLPPQKLVRVIVTTSSGYTTTDGNYYLSYRPFSRSLKKKKKPFVIRCDLFHHCITRVYSMDDFSRGLQRVNGVREPLEWLKKYTTINNDTFEIAINNPGLKVFFSIDPTKLMADFGPHVTTESIRYHLGDKK